MNPTTPNKLIIPIAIIAAGLLVAGAIVITKMYPTSDTATNDSVKTAKDIKIRPISSDDHILGNPEAEIVIVEYSDTECPFCKAFHSTLQSVIDEYGKDGKVAWVYRHFPISQLHSKAQKEAEATECATELGGKSMFWDYINRLYAITPSNDGLDPAKLVTIATDLKLDKAAFETCLSSGKYKDRVQKDYDEAIAAGARGTPHSIILTKRGDKLPIEGAQSLEDLKGIINSLLKGN